MIRVNRNKKTLFRRIVIQLSPIFTVQVRSLHGGVKMLQFLSRLFLRSSNRRKFTEIFRMFKVYRAWWFVHVDRSSCRNLLQSTVTFSRTKFQTACNRTDRINLLDYNSRLIHSFHTSLTFRTSVFIFQFVPPFEIVRSILSIAQQQTVPPIPQIWSSRTTTTTMNHALAEKFRHKNHWLTFLAPITHKHKEHRSISRDRAPTGLNLP